MEYHDRHMGDFTPRLKCTTFRHERLLLDLDLGPAEFVFLFVILILFLRRRRTRSMGALRVLTSLVFSGLGPSDLLRSSLNAFTLTVLRTLAAFAALLSGHPLICFRPLGPLFDTGLIPVSLVPTSQLPLPLSCYSSAGSFARHLRPCV